MNKFLIAIAVLVVLIGLSQTFIVPKIDAKIEEQDRDAIQKVTDNIAVTYRRLQETKAKLSEIELQYIEDLENYSSALESFSIYQN